MAVLTASETVDTTVDLMAVRKDRSMAVPLEYLTDRRKAGEMVETMAL